MKQILKVIVGSQAHGLANKDSDYDYRGVFVVPTSEILKLGGNMRHTHWQEGKVDDTSWEIGHFLNLATKSNPTILETFLSPVVDEDTEDLQKLFPYVWNSKDVMNAFCGYGHNQRKKFLEEKDGRPNKFAVAYLRVLFNGYELLSSGTFTIKVSDSILGATLHRWRCGDYNIGEVIQTCCEWEKRLREAFEKNPDKQTNIDKVNEYLLKIRRDNWI